MSIDALSEPKVLVEAKEFLTGETGDGYAVVDSQFQQTSWGDVPITENLQHRLQPINSIPLRNGYPDAIIAPPDSEFYRTNEDGHIDGVPLAVIEAKGETRQSNRNATRIGITQAHSHIEDVNVAYAAVPEDTISQSDRALARELNVGLIVVSKTDIELLEEPRIVGSQSSETADTIRFHAKLGGITVESLTKNHPKNAIGFALAVSYSENPEDTFTEFVIKSVDDARLDATALGLIGGGVDRLQLTTLGREVVRNISYHYGGTLSALEAINEQTGKKSRFIDELPVMGSVARHVLLTYPPTQVLVNTLDDLAKAGNPEPTLATVAKMIAEDRPEFALDLFVSPRDRHVVLQSSGNQGSIDVSKFDIGEVYSTHTTFQYKAMLYHVGLLTTRGHDKKSELNPDEDVWALETSSISKG